MELEHEKKNEFVIKQGRGKKKISEECSGSTDEKELNPEDITLDNETVEIEKEVGVINTDDLIIEPLFRAKIDINPQYRYGNMVPSDVVFTWKSMGIKIDLLVEQIK